MDFLTHVEICTGLMALSFGLGYYIGGRGMDGVKIDLDNTKNELEKIKELVVKKTNAKTVTVVAPVGSAKATDTVESTTTSTK